MQYQTLQEIFDTAVAGLASQKWERSLTQHDGVIGGSCAYRGVGGKRCAIGWCIPDDLYDAGTEGGTPTNNRFHKAYASLFSGIDSVKLAELQEAHDMAGDDVDMRCRLRRFAADFGLEIPAVLREPSE